MRIALNLLDTAAAFMPYPGQDGILILDAVGLVNDDVAPVELLKVVLLLDDHLITGHHHIKFAHGTNLLLLVYLQAVDTPLNSTHQLYCHFSLPQQHAALWRNRQGEGLRRTLHTLSCIFGFP